MFRGLSRKEKLLRQRLRQEAEQALFPVPPALHERFCRAIRQGGTANSGACPIPTRARLFPRYAAPAVAAACVMLIVGALWQVFGPMARPNPANVVPVQVARAPAQPANVSQVSVDVISLTRLGSDTLTRANAVVDATTVSPQWAYLDHDARLALHMFADRFPFNAGD